MGKRRMRRRFEAAFKARVALAAIRGDKTLSIAEQCALLDLLRSTYYHAGVGESAENLALMRVIDEQYLDRTLQLIRSWGPANTALISMKERRRC
jgi:transposase-like protein